LRSESAALLCSQPRFEEHGSQGLLEHVFLKLQVSLTISFGIAGGAG
jgi:hypothetical protein